jgi:predicted ferric reductase
MLVVVALWVANRGLQDLGGVWSGATSLGRLTGLVSSDLLLIQVLLLARIPWVERSYGQDRLVRWHRLVGFTSFNLMLAHILLIGLGYAGSVRGLVRQLWDLGVDYPGMLLAYAAVGMLTAVAVTSIRAARRKLRYESWHLLHLYAYLGVALALPHQLWTGTAFTSSPVATVYWWTLWAAAAVAIVVFRVGVPLARTAYHRLEVSHVVKEASGVYSVHLRGRHLDRLPVRAGQFFNWRFRSGPGWSRAHPYSLSAAPSGTSLRITVKNLGDDSAEVARLRRGTKVLIEGPYGRLTGESYRGGPVTLLGCGVGITPLRALLEELPYPYGAATLVYRIRSDADIVFKAELEAIAAKRGVRVVYVPGPRAGTDSWLPRTAAHLSDAAALRSIVPNLAANDLYLCGPDDWMSAVQAAAVAVGVPKRHIHSERFCW